MVALQRFYKEEDKGVLPFVYGVDLHKGMDDDAMVHINKSAPDLLRKRELVAETHKLSFEDALKHVSTDKHKRSHEIVKTYVNRLLPDQIGQLYLKVI